MKSWQGREDFVDAVVQNMQEVIEPIYKKRGSSEEKGAEGSRKGEKRGGKGLLPNGKGTGTMRMRSVGQGV